MSDISATMVKELRNKTGAGIMDCKEALKINNGDIEQAAGWLRQKGISKAEKKASRETNEGQIGSYIHPGGRVGVLIEVNCETDFVAKTDEFQELVRSLAMQVAAMQPTYISRDEVPQDVIDAELAGYRQAAIEDGKPENIADKIAQGKVDKYFQAQCLMEQEYVKESSKSVDDLIKETISKTGENIRVKRFARFDLAG
ncbi:MAG: translation elongation factor Ts [Candidatus Eremiobacteraeota bacterium]|nr:translation elongation factor Ts [Candidatus Eremiobacteraeota bacterium]